MLEDHIPYYRAVCHAIACYSAVGNATALYSAIGCMSCYRAICHAIGPKTMLQGYTIEPYPQDRGHRRFYMAICYAAGPYVMGYMPCCRPSAMLQGHVLGHRPCYRTISHVLAVHDCAAAYDMAPCRSIGLNILRVDGNR